MANVVNPEPESTTLITELETLEPASEQEQPSPESTSNTETPKAVEESALDADALSEPVASVAPVAEETPVAEATAQAAPADEVATDVHAPPVPDAPAEPVVAAPVKAAASAEHSLDHMDDFSAALEAFEREQAAEAAAVEA